MVFCWSSKNPKTASIFLRISSCTQILGSLIKKDKCFHSHPDYNPLCCSLLFTWPSFDMLTTPNKGKNSPSLKKPVAVDWIWQLAKIEPGQNQTQRESRARWSGCRGNLVPQGSQSFLLTDRQSRQSRGFSLRGEQKHSWGLVFRMDALRNILSCF